jgi:hypothetical protein
MPTPSAEPQGVNDQIEQVMIGVLQEALPSYTTTDTPPTTRPILYRGWWSKEQQVFPMVEVQCRMGSYTPTAAGGAYNVSPTGVMIPSGAAAAFPQTVPQLQIISGGRCDDSEVDLKLSAQSAAERSILSGRLRSLLFSGFNSSNVAWIRVLSYYGVRMLRISPDLFDEQDGEGIENAPMVFTNILSITVSTTFVSIRIPDLGDGASLVERLVAPAGIAPPPTF